MMEPPKGDDKPRLPALFLLHALFGLTLFICVLPLAFSRATLDGDGLQYAQLYRDLFVDGFSYFNWSPPPGRGFQLLLLVDFALFALAPDLLTAYVLIATWMALLCFYSSRAVLSSVVPLCWRRRMLRDLLLLAFVAVALSLFAETFVIYRRIETMVVLVYLSLLSGCIACALHYLRSPRRRYLLGLCSCFVVGALGSMKFNYLMALPLLASLGFLASVASVCRSEKARRLWLLFGLVFGLFGLVYFFAYPLLTPSHRYLSSYMPAHLTDLSESWSGFWNELIGEAFRRGSLLLQLLLVGLFGTLVGLGIAGLEVARRWAKSRVLDDRRLALDLVVVLSTAGVWAAFLANLLKTPGTVARYYLPAAYFLALFGLSVACRVLVRLPLPGVRLLWGISVAAPLLLTSVALHRYEGLKELDVSFEKRAQFSPDTGDMQALAFCLDAHKELHGLRAGVAEYWTARPVEMMSKKGLRVSPIARDLSFYHWITNLERFWKGSAKTGAPRYNFAITGYHRLPWKFREWWLTLPAKQKRWYRSLFRGRFAREPRLPEDQKLLRRFLRWQGTRSISEALLRERFGPPRSSFVCKQSHGLRKILVYPPGFDAALKRHFRQQYERMRRRPGYPFRID